MRFIPGAINRWRAIQHIEKMKSLGMKIKHTNRHQEKTLPVAVESIHEDFRLMGEVELRTIAADIVALKT